MRTSTKLSLRGRMRDEDWGIQKSIAAPECSHNGEGLPSNDAPGLRGTVVAQHRHDSGGPPRRYDQNKALCEDSDPNWSLAMSERKPRLVINHSLSVARTELAKLSKSRPIMEVVANSNEPEDIAATKVAKSALDYAEWKFKLQKLRRAAWWWMFSCGLGAIYCGWDYLNQDAGTFKFLIDPETGEPTFNPTRRREIEAMVQ